MTPKRMWFVRVSPDGTANGTISTTPTEDKAKAWTVAYRWLQRANAGVRVELVCRYPDGQEFVNVNVEAQS